MDLDSQDRNESTYFVCFIERCQVQGRSSECKVLLLQANMKPVRFEVFTAVTMKNVVFWHIKTQFVLHRRFITSPLQSSAS
jgi:hypothetical protein